jgi:hypothetical protein
MEKLDDKGTCSARTVYDNYVAAGAKVHDMIAEPPPQGALIFWDLVVNGENDGYVAIANGDGGYPALNSKGKYPAGSKFGTCITSCAPNLGNGVKHDGIPSAANGKVTTVSGSTISTRYDLKNLGSPSDANMKCLGWINPVDLTGDAPPNEIAGAAEVFAWVLEDHTNDQEQLSCKNNWYYWCLDFVHTAWRAGAKKKGVKIDEKCLTQKTAQEAYKAFAAAGKVHWDFWTAPKGAVLFYRFGGDDGFGHITIANGNGKTHVSTVRSTDPNAGKDPDGNKVLGDYEQPLIYHYKGSPIAGDGTPLGADDEKKPGAKSVVADDWLREKVGPITWDGATQDAALKAGLDGGKRFDTSKAPFLPNAAVRKGSTISMCSPIGFLPCYGWVDPTTA